MIMVYIVAPLVGAVAGWMLCQFVAWIGSPGENIWQNASIARARIVVCVVGAVLGGLLMPPYTAERVKVAQQYRATYEASLRHVTVTVTEVEPVVRPESDSMVGALILTKEYPGQKIYVRFTRGLKAITVEDRLELTLDEWTVMKVGRVSK